MTQRLPPLIFSSPDRAYREWLRRLKARKHVRRVGPRLYSSLKGPALAKAIRASWSTVVSTLFPSALLSHRSAFDFAPTPNGELFLTGSTNRVVKYPGLVLVFSRGAGPLEDDARFLAMHASSRARALLENLATPRGRRPAKYASREDIEKRLEQLVVDGGEAALNEVRDHARVIAATLGWKTEFARLDTLIGAVLGTRTPRALKTDSAKARALGEPFDVACLERLHLLYAELNSRALRTQRDTFEAVDHFSNKAFFEAYFSNFIEGTTFEIEEAEDIIFNKQTPATRPQDAHDILGTYEIVADRSAQARVPNTLADFVGLLKSRHATFMAFRPHTSPGQFKQQVNRAGDTVFVHPDSVLGTLKKGFELYRTLAPGLPRAIFMMFLTADVHPFLDGNGRLARMMMNAELVAQSATTIIIPTVYREDYLLTLRALTRRNRAKPLVDMVVRAHHFSRLEFSPYPAILKELRRRNWFREPGEAKIVE